MKTQLQDLTAHELAVVAEVFRYRQIRDRPSEVMYELLGARSRQHDAEFDESFGRLTGLDLRALKVDLESGV